MINEIPNIKLQKQVSWLNSYQWRGLDTRKSTGYIYMDFYIVLPDGIIISQLFRCIKRILTFLVQIKQFLGKIIKRKVDNKLRKQRREVPLIRKDIENKLAKHKLMKEIRADLRMKLNFKKKYL